MNIRVYLLFTIIRMIYRREDEKKSIKTRRAWAEVEASKPIMRQIAKPTPGSRQVKTIRLDASLQALFALLLTFRHLAGILISTFRPQVREREASS